MPSLWAVSGLRPLAGALPLDGGVLGARSSCGLVVLLVAVTILSAFQARTIPGPSGSPSPCSTVGAIGYVLGLLGLVGVSEGDLAVGRRRRTVALVGAAVGGA